METKLTKELKQEIYRATSKMGVFGCFEVTIGWNGKERVDYMTYDTNDIFRCYEVKATEKDFHSQCANSFLGHYNYYVLPDDLYDNVRDSIPDFVGVYIGETCVKKAKKIIPPVDTKILMQSMLRSLSREADYVFKNRDELQLLKARGERDYYRSQSETHKRDFNDLLQFIYNTFGSSWQKAFYEWRYKHSEKEKKEMRYATLRKMNEEKHEAREEHKGEDVYINLTTMFK